MSGNINVNRSVTDAFYRYKMPRLIAKVEGKGNGIKTVIVNMSEIAKALSRPPTYPTKYFGCELGAQTQFDQKNDRYIVNGSHDSTKLQNLLDGFIKKFVLCPECENPETILTVQTKKQMILQRCAACGYQGNIDMRHKLTTFILKNPPESDAAAANADVPTTTPGKKEKKKEGKSTDKKSKAGKDAVNGNGDTNAADGQDNNHDAPHSPSVLNHEDEDWGEDTSDAAVQARFDAISSAARTMTVCDDLEKPEQERIDMFYSFVKQRKISSGVVGAEKEKEILLEAERLDIKDKAPMVLAELLFDANMAQQIKEYRSLLCRFTDENDKAQRYLLGGFEQLVGKVHRDILLPKVSKILSEFYQHDILSEEVILDWAKKPSKKYVSKEIAKVIHSQAEKFLEWLKNAEEESSEEEEDDGNVEVVYSNNTADKPTVATAKDATAAISGSKSVKDEPDEDDLNIDDI